MIFKVRKHRSKRHLRNLVRYLLSRKGKSNERVLRHESLNALPIFPGESPLNYAKQWSAALWNFTAKERCGKPPPEDYFVHSVMSFFPGNAEHAADQLTAEQAIALAKEAMAEVAPGERQALYVVHGDKAHLHVHIVFSVVERGGRIWNPRMDFRLWEAAAAQLEVKYGLYQVTVGRPGGVPAKKKSPTCNELNMAIRTGKPSDRMLLQQLLDAALAGKPSFPTFIHRLINAGVTPIPNIASTGRVSGISFRLGDGLPMKGSDLGKGYSWGALSKQLNFAASQHLHLLRPFVAEQPLAGGAVKFDQEVDAPVLPLSESLPKIRRFIAKPRSDQSIDWVWRNKPTRTAFVESARVCVARSPHSAVYEAMAERSRQRGLKRVGVRGSEAFRRRMWFELSFRGISAVGYEPTEADRNRLEWWINEQAKNGRGNDPARSPAPSGRAVTGIGSEAGRDAENESGNERRVGRDDVSVASGDDLAGAGKPGADEGNALDDAGGNLRNESGDGRVAFIDEGAKKSAFSAEVESAGLSSAKYPTPTMHRASRLGQAALLRQGVQSVQSSDDWRVVMDMLWELNRRFIRWGIVFGMPGKALLGELTHHAKIAPSWANLQIINSQGCNVDLQLTAPNSWLHLEGVTALDFERLAAQGVTPTIQFTSGGITQVFVHVNYGCESRQLMDCLAEQLQVGLDASVRAHIGQVSFPVPGFDCWSDEQLRVCSGISFDGSSMGTQLSNQLGQLKGELDRSRILGAVPVPILGTMTEGGAESLREKRTVRREPPRPSEY